MTKKAVKRQVHAKAKNGGPFAWPKRRPKGPTE